MKAYCDEKEAGINHHHGLEVSSYQKGHRLGIFHKTNARKCLPPVVAAIENDRYCGRPIK